MFICLVRNILYLGINIAFRTVNVKNWFLAKLQYLLAYKGNTLGCCKSLNANGEQVVCRRAVCVVSLVNSVVMTKILAFLGAVSVVTTPGGFLVLFIK
jgi:hypothetical protein